MANGRCASVQQPLQTVQVRILHHSMDGLCCHAHLPPNAICACLVNCIAPITSHHINIKQRTSPTSAAGDTAP